MRAAVPCIWMTYFGGRSEHFKRKAVAHYMAIISIGNSGVAAIASKGYRLLAGGPFDELA